MAEGSVEKETGEFKHSQLQDTERSELHSAFALFFENEYSALFNNILAVTGLLLGTLSSSKIHPLVNILILIVASFFIWRQIGNTEKTSELSKVINNLYDRYPENKANHATRKEIDSFNFHRNVSKRIFRKSSALAFITCFLVYVAVEHSLRYVQYCNEPNSCLCLAR